MVRRMLKAPECGRHALGVDPAANRLFLLRDDLLGLLDDLRTDSITLHHAGTGSSARRPIGKMLAKCCSFSAVSASIFASRIFWFQLFLVWQPSNLPEPMKNQQTLGNRGFSNEEPHLPLSCRLRRRAKIFRNLGIFEKKTNR